jgi:flagellar hook-associated protein 1 FlgK
MSSQFFGLNIAYTGLLASNAALNTTANNIANVQTDGYSRQEVQQQAASALRVFQTYGCAGAGVETLAVERVRDEFYDTKYWNNNAKVGEYDMKQYYMEQVETYFNDNGENAGFKTVFDQLMTTGLQELMKNPSSDTTKAQFVGYADSLVEYFNGLAGNMEALQKDVNQEIKLKVDEINSLAGQIANLNKQINTIELAGTKANELRDRRTLLLDQLSEIVDIETIETPIVDTNNPERETGANRFMVKIAGGQLLVDNSEYRGLECVARTSYEKVNQTDIDGLYDVYWEDGQKFNLYNGAMGGDLKGLVQMRDGNNGENFTGTITAVGTVTNPDTGATQDTVTIQVNKSYLQDLNKCNLSDQGGIINLGNQEFYYDSWEYTYNANTDTYSYTFTLSQSGGSGDKNTTGVTNDRVGKTASIGSSIDYQGVPYYMSQMNEWIRTFAEKFNDILTSGYTADNLEGIKMFTADHATDEEQFDLPDSTRYDQGSSVTVKATDDSYYRMTAKNLSILAAMENDPSLMANKSSAADGVEQGDLLSQLKTMATDKDQVSFRGSSASEFLQNILSDVALNASSANTFSKSFANISYTIDNQRISISGVDEDEEAVSLVKYQNAYNLASKMIQTLTEVYDRLILETGV